MTSASEMTVNRSPFSIGPLKDGWRSRIRAIEMWPVSSAYSLFKERAPSWAIRSVAFVCEHLTVAISNSLGSVTCGSKPPDPFANLTLKPRMSVGSPAGIRHPHGQVREQRSPTNAHHADA